jgi:hypothetical protein
MAGIPPFTSGTTPLKNAPYFSRVADINLRNDNTNVNYPMLAFKPGYALQASELNEIQDNFYVQKTLSDSLLQNWWKTGTNLNLTGSSTEYMSGPGWDGAIPLNPSAITAVENVGQINFSTPSALQWFLVTDPSTKFKFWATFDTSYLVSNIAIIKATAPSLVYVGMRVKTSIVNCSSVETEAGYIFNDNSSGGYISNTCGASRFKIELDTDANPYGKVTSISGNFLPIFKVRKNPNADNQNTFLIQYMNNYLIAKIPTT